LRDIESDRALGTSARTVTLNLDGYGKTTGKYPAGTSRKGATAVAPFSCAWKIRRVCACAGG
jgi:hypothetical protein